MNELGMEKIKWCIVPEMVCVLLITFFTMLGQDTLVSMVFMWTFLILLLVVIQIVSGGKMNSKLFILVTISVLAVLLNLLWVGRGTVGFDYFKKIIMFLTSVLFFYYGSNITVSEKTIRRIKICMLATAAILPISYYVMGNQDGLGDFITINYSNPNFTGMWLLTSIVTLVYLLVSTKKMWYRGVVLLVLIIDIQLLFMTQARGSIVGLFLFVVLLPFSILIKKYRFPKIAVVILILLPLIVAIIYLLVVDNVRVISMLDFMISEGKSLSSRSDIWKFALEHIKNSPLVGDYWGISGGMGGSQLHNIALDIMASYGIPVFILYTLVLYKCTAWVCNVKNPVCFIALSGFFASYASGCFEAGLVAGSMGLSIYVGMLLVAGRHEYISAGK